MTEGIIEAERSIHYSSQKLLRALQFALDVFVLAGSFLAAYQLRFEFAVPESQARSALIQLPYIVLIQLASLSFVGVYSFIWRYVGMGELKAFFRAAFYASVPIIAARLALPANLHEYRVPLSVCLTDAMLAFGGVLGLRVVRRLFYENSRSRPHARLGAGSFTEKRVLLIGAGRAGMLAAREIQANGSVDLKIEGFVDDNPNKLGANVGGVRVIGTTRDLPALVRDLGIDHVIISMAQASRADFRRILDICEEIPIKVRVIPALDEIIQGKVNVSRIRDLQIEDLLGREPIQLDDKVTQGFLAGKTVMVTGAGGSIGSELARQVALFAPARLLLVERAEFALFEIDRELRAAFPELHIVPLVVDLNDESGLQRIFSAYQPQIVLHSAAHKHVPMMELNSVEAVKNNIFATRLLAELSGKHRVDTFVLMSSDKAVRPTSVMGATKRVAELVVQDMDTRFATKYVSVRFGNVIGSTGSVIPIFREQIRNGGPVTVTHPDMKRYFMTIREAAQLVLQAGAMGGGGEIFILDMGEQVRILDLAKAAITLSGLKPFVDIEVVFSGIRPGEKLYEELAKNEEEMSKTRHPKIFIGKIHGYPQDAIRRAIRHFESIVARGDERELREFLGRLLPEATLEGSKDDATKQPRMAQAASAFGVAVADNP